MRYVIKVKFAEDKLIKKGRIIVGNLYWKNRTGQPICILWSRQVAYFDSGTYQYILAKLCGRYYL